MSAHYRIVEWDRYQHYKDRDPPWIKLHRDLLTSQTWVTLADSSRVLAVACMLIAAGTDNRIPANAAYLKRRAYLNKEPDFSPLVACGFVEYINDNENKDVADASNTLASASNMLASATECSSEKRRGRVEKRRGETLPEDWSPTPEQLEYAKQQGCADPADTAERFKLHHRSKGTLGKDWNAGFQYWCRNEKNFKRAEPQKFNGKNGSHAVPTVSDDAGQWQARLRGYHPGGFWSPMWGPRPENGGCHAPPSILAEWRQQNAT
jgi:hypothetical protein